MLAKLGSSSLDRMYKLLRRGSGRMLVLCAVLLSVLLCLYYVSQTQNSPGGSAAIIAESAAFERVLTSALPDYSEPPDGQVSPDTCPLVAPRDTDIDAQAEFEKFDFQVNLSYMFYFILFFFELSIVSFIPVIHINAELHNCVSSLWYELTIFILLLVCGYYFDGEFYCSLSFL